MSNPYDFDTDNDIGLGDEDKGRVRSNKTDWYDLTEKGRTDRAALVYFHPEDINQLAKVKRAKPDITEAQAKAVIEKVRATKAEKLGKKADELTVVDMLDLTETKFKAVDASYKEGFGYAQWPKHLEPHEKEVWNKLPERKTYVMTVLLIYPTDREGNIEKERLANGWKILPWRFSADKYEVMKRINRKLLAREDGSSLATTDLLLTCKEPKFKNITIEDAGPAIWLKSDKFKHAVLEKAVEFYSKLTPFKQYTTEELREKLGLGGGGVSPGSEVAAEAYADILNNL